MNTKTYYWRFGIAYPFVYIILSDNYYKFSAFSWKSYTHMQTILVTSFDLGELFLQCTYSASLCMKISTCMCINMSDIYKIYRAKFYKRTRIKVVNLFSLEELLSMYINLFQTFLVFNLYVLWVSSWSLWYVLYE